MAIDSAGGAPRLAERIEYECPPGAAAWFWRQVPPATVIDELRIAVALRSDQPGLQVVAEVVLPRSTDPTTGQPRRLLVRSPTSVPQPPGDALLRIDGFPLAVERHARVARLGTLGESIDAAPTSIDPRGAYLTRVGLIAPGSEKAAALDITEVRVEGLVPPPERHDDPGGLVDDGPTLDAPTGVEARPAPIGGRTAPSKVTLTSEGFRVDGAPYFTRAWSWRGEDLAALARGGFNTLWLDEPPSPELLRDAASRRIRLLCPPPPDDGGFAIHENWNPVLAWVLAGERDERALDMSLADIDRLRSLPVDRQRPVLVLLRGDAAPWSRAVDGVVIPSVSSRVAGASADFVRRAARSVRPGTPIVAMIDADVGRGVQRQLDALVGEGVTPAWLPLTDIAHQTQGALAGSARGIIYRGTERLDTVDAPTVLAANWLAVLNHHLRLVEPWLLTASAPRPVGRSAVSIDRQGAQLVVSALLPSAEAFSAGAAGKLAAALPEPIVLPGEVDPSQLHRLSPGGVRQAVAKRAGGGLRVERAAGDESECLLVARDPRVIDSLRRYTAGDGAAAAAAWVAVAGSALELADSIDAATKAEARRSIGEANLAVAQREHAAACVAAARALAAVERIGMARRAVARQSPAIESAPLALLPATLTDHFRLAELLAVAPRGPNQLYGGSFEDINDLRVAGWRHPRGGGRVDLAEGSPIHGKRRLRLTGDDDGPATIVSPPVELAAGETVEVTGWVQVPADAPDSSAALEVSDSLGGPELALEIGATDGWKPFRLVRRTLIETSLTIRLRAPRGAVAEVDGVMARVVLPRGAEPRQAAAPAHAK
jgi:hypothetical protein